MSWRQGPKKTVEDKMYEAIGILTDDRNSASARSSATDTLMDIHANNIKITAYDKASIAYNLAVYGLSLGHVSRKQYADMCLTECNNAEDDDINIMKNFKELRKAILAFKADIGENVDAIQAAEDVRKESATSAQVKKDIKAAERDVDEENDYDEPGAGSPTKYRSFFN